MAAEIKMAIINQTIYFVKLAGYSLDDYVSAGQKFISFYTFKIDSSVYQNQYPADNWTTEGKNG